eukprot:scaffold94630_cov27-Attheya_sp.AAC.1
MTREVETHLILGRTLWRLRTNVGNAAVWHIPSRCELHGTTRQTSERQTTYQRNMFASSIESESESTPTYGRRGMAASLWAMMVRTHLPGHVTPSFGAKEHWIDDHTPIGPTNFNRSYYRV